MSQEVKNLSPKEIWNNFTEINKIPRASKKEEKIIEYVKNFGEKLGLETIIDSVQNVIIKKPATVGMENRKTVILQSHLDMVCQKNNDTVFDFETEGIKMYIDGDWVKAKGTTLGADNGIGVATILAILESTNIAHPAIEALFTIDEETGMTGALGLEAGYLEGEILLNSDTEDDDELGVGCAGGMDVTAKKSYLKQEVSSTSKAVRISVKGLQGGHSGVDIHKEFGNANKIMNRILFATLNNISIATIDGGSLRNAIPRESNAVVMVNNKVTFKEKFAVIANDIKNEYKYKEPDLEIRFVDTETPKFVLPKEDAQKLVQVIYASFNGVFRMSPDIEGLVETSNNVARILVENGEIIIKCLTRSSVESGKWDIVNMLKSTFELADFQVILAGDYPGWKPNPDSNILKVLKAKYTTLFKEEPKVIACHAGLECGILGTNYPNMDMISFGPTIMSPHSPDERVSISSVQKFWGFIIEILKDIPLAQ